MNTIKPRRPQFRLDEDIPRHWYRNSAFGTHFLNALHLLFPQGERFFIRTVKPFTGRISDPQLQEAVRAFIAQEMQHSLQHSRYWSYLEAQGYDTAMTEKIINTLEDLVSRISREDFRLAMTAGFEHFTSFMADIALRQNIFRGMHPEMERLFRWHAAGEIEHKAVAFDLLRHVNPDPLLRYSGMVVAAVVLFGFITGITGAMLARDGKLTELSSWQDAWKLMVTEYGFAGRSAREFLKYFSPDFHPDEADNLELALQVLETA